MELCLSSSFSFYLSLPLENSNKANVFRLSKWRTNTQKFFSSSSPSFTLILIDQKVR